MIIPNLSQVIPNYPKRAVAVGAVVAPAGVVIVDHQVVAWPSEPIDRCAVLLDQAQRVKSLGADLLLVKNTRGILGALTRCAEEGIWVVVV